MQTLPARRKPTGAFPSSAPRSLLPSLPPRLGPWAVVVFAAIAAVLAVPLSIFSTPMVGVSNARSACREVERLLADFEQRRLAHPALSEAARRCNGGEEEGPAGGTRRVPRQELRVSTESNGTGTRFRAALTQLRDAPVTGAQRTVTSPFGWRTGPDGVRKFHRGIDLRASTGTAVHALGAGVVTFASWRSGYGFMVEMSHGRVATRYAHLSGITVEVGARVAAGEQIAASGATGNARGPHLHLEVLDDGTNLDPADFLDDPSLIFSSDL